MIKILQGGKMKRNS